MAINDILFRPAWFITTESLFEIISFLITLIISFYSYKVYKILGNSKYKYLTVAFFSISIGFLFKVISNLVVLDYVDFNALFSFIHFIKDSYYYTGALILYSFLILSGYVILSCLALNIRNRRVILSFMFIALLCAILVRQARSFTFFYFFAFVLLVVFIVPYMYENYKKVKNINSYLVFISFLFLALSNFLFIAISAYHFPQIYIAGQALGLLAFVSLLINLILVLKK